LATLSEKYVVKQERKNVRGESMGGYVQTKPQGICREYLESRHAHSHLGLYSVLISTAFNLASIFSIQFFASMVRTHSKMGEN